MVFMVLPNISQPMILLFDELENCARSCCYLSLQYISNFYQKNGTALQKCIEDKTTQNNQEMEYLRLDVVSLRRTNVPGHLFVFHNCIFKGRNGRSMSFEETLQATVSRSQTDNKFQPGMCHFTVPNQVTEYQRTCIFGATLVSAFHGSHFEMLISPQALHDVVQGLAQEHRLLAKSHVSWCQRFLGGHRIEHVWL